MDPFERLLGFLSKLQAPQSAPAPQEQGPPSVIAARQLARDYASGAKTLPERDTRSFADRDPLLMVPRPQPFGPLHTARDASAMRQQDQRGVADILRGAPLQYDPTQQQAPAPAPVRRSPLPTPMEIARIAHDATRTPATSTVVVRRPVRTAADVNRAAMREVTRRESIRSGLQEAAGILGLASGLPGAGALLGPSIVAGIAAHGGFRADDAVMLGLAAAPMVGPIRAAAKTHRVLLRGGLASEHSSAALAEKAANRLVGMSNGKLTRAEITVEEAVAAPKIAAKASKEEKRAAAILSLNQRARTLLDLIPAERARLALPTTQSIARFGEAVASFEKANITPSVLASGVSAGAEGRGWWKGAQDAIAAKLSPADRPKFAKVLAAFSPQTSVEVNTENAVNLWEWWVKAGRPEMDAYALSEMFKAGLVRAMDTHAPNVARALRGAPLSGPKVAGMDAALQGDVDGMVLDAWMARVTNWAANTLGGRSVATGAQTRATSQAFRKGKRPLPAGRLVDEKLSLPEADYIAFEALVRETAETLRIEPREAQEMLWVYMKSIEPRLVGKPEQLRGILGESDMAKLLTGTPRSPIQYAGPSADPAHLAILERNAQLSQLGSVQRGSLSAKEQQVAASIRRSLTDSDVANLNRVGINTYAMALPVAGGALGAMASDDEGKGLVGGTGLGLLASFALGPLARATNQKLTPFLASLDDAVKAGKPAGATIDIARGVEPALSAGRYSVGTTAVALDALTPEAIRAVAAQAPKGSVVGLWYDRAAGKWYAEASTLTNSLDEALELGRRRNQIAIGDRSKYAQGLDGDVMVARQGPPPTQGVVDIDEVFRPFDRPFLSPVKAVPAERGADMARVYESLVSAPNDPQVQAAYRAFADETRAQYEALRKAGYRFEFVTQDPYKNSREMIEDVWTNRRLKVFKTNDSARHPLLSNEENDIFRAVHDLQHARGAQQFGPVGEENVMRIHAASYSPAARRAMMTETRGQNSWFNFGPNAKLPVKQRPFARQKAALWPKEFSGDYGDMPSFSQLRGAPSAAAAGKAAERALGGRSVPRAPLVAPMGMSGHPRGPQTMQTLPGHLRPDDWHLLHPDGKPPLL